MFSAPRGVKQPTVQAADPLPFLPGETGPRRPLRPPAGERPGTRPSSPTSSRFTPSSPSTSTRRDSNHPTLPSENQDEDEARELERLAADDHPSEFSSVRTRTTRTGSSMEEQAPTPELLDDEDEDMAARGQKRQRYPSSTLSGATRKPPDDKAPRVASPPTPDGETSGSSGPEPAPSAGPDRPPPAVRGPAGPSGSRQAEGFLDKLVRKIT